MRSKLAVQPSEDRGSSRRLPVTAQVGKYKSKLEAQGWEYEMQVSFLEIYNEQIRDLLRENNGTKVIGLVVALWRLCWLTVPLLTVP